MKPYAPSRATSVCIALLGGLVACTGIAERAANEATAPVVRIPFTLTAADNVSIRATLNATDPVDLMFHTAVDSVSLTKAAIARLTSFRADQSVTVHSWGGTTQARHSTGNTLQIGELAWRDVAVTEDENSGHGTDGKFGPCLFAGQIVEIDFDARQLVIHPTLPAIGSRFELLDLVFRHGAMFVTGELTVGERRYSTEFMLHTGFGGTALLDEQFVRTHALGEKLVTSSESELQDSYGNPVKTRKVRLPILRFGATTFADVPVGIFDGALGSQRMSVLGSGLLKRCNLIIDAANGHLYVSPSQAAGAPFGS